MALPRPDRPRGQFIQLYQQVVGEISAQATGTHDIFLLFHSDDKKLVGEFEYLRFEQYRGRIPLHKNEVKLEVRVGAKDGEKIGEFYPRFTGGADVFRDMVVTFEPGKLTSKQPLYFVVRSATDKPIGTIDYISLQKARQPMDLTGLGIEPLRRDGHYVFPDPTHRPLPPDIRRLLWRLRQKLEAHTVGRAEPGSVAERASARGGTAALEASPAGSTAERHPPPLRVIDLLRRYTPEFVERHGSQAVPQVRSVLSKLALCRTAALGGHVYECPRCQHRCPVYNSCIDRHCPQCSGGRRADWLEKTATLLLPGINYFQVVFTLPEELSALMLGNRRVT